jgi:hypothetical protein
MGETGRPNPGPGDRFGNSAEESAELDQLRAEQRLKQERQAEQRRKALDEVADPSGNVHPDNRNAGKG